MWLYNRESLFLFQKLSAIKFHTLFNQDVVVINMEGIWNLVKWQSSVQFLYLRNIGQLSMLKNDIPHFSLFASIACECLYIRYNTLLMLCCYRASQVRTRYICCGKQPLVSVIIFTIFLISSALNCFKYHLYIYSVQVKFCFIKKWLIACPKIKKKVLKPCNEAPPVIFSNWH